MRNIVVAFFVLGLSGFVFGQETITLEKIGKGKTKELDIKRINGIETKDYQGRLSGEVVSIDKEQIAFKFKVIVDSVAIDLPHRNDKFYYSEVMKDTVVNFAYNELNALYYSKIKNKEAFKTSQKVVNYLFLGTLGVTIVGYVSGEETVGTVAAAGVAASGLAFIYLTIKDSPKKYKFETWEVK